MLKYLIILNLLLMSVLAIHKVEPELPIDDSELANSKDIKNSLETAIKTTLAPFTTTILNSKQNDKLIIPSTVSSVTSKSKKKSTSSKKKTTKLSPKYRTIRKKINKECYYKKSYGNTRYRWNHKGTITYRPAKCTKCCRYKHFTSKKCVEVRCTLMGRH